MRNRQLTASLLVSGLVLFAGCGNNDAPGTAPDSMEELHRQLGPTSMSFTVDAEAGGAIRGSSIALEIGPGVIRGATGPVTVELREFQTVGDMVRGDRPTMTDRGELLESSGAFELEARDAAGDPVDVLELANVKFRKWPEARSDGMGAWVAAPEAPAWAQPAPLDRIRPKTDAGSYLFNSLPFGGIGRYSAYNCDAIANLATDRMTLKIQLAPELVAEAGVFFLPDGVNTAAKLYTKDLSLPGFVSYANMMPVGVRGKLIVVALDDNRYYLYHDDAFTIPAGTSNGSGREATLLIAPVEVPEAEFFAYMNAL